MSKVQRRGVWLGPSLLVVATLTAVTALLGTTPTFAHARPLPLKITIRRGDLDGCIQGKPCITERSEASRPNEPDPSLCSG